MIKYQGYRENDCTAIVEVVLPDGNKELLNHIVHHSPTGLNWGYAGSGPADLARSILIDYRKRENLNFDVDAWYQTFKFKHVACQGELFTLSSDDVRDFLIEMGAIDGE